MSQVPNPKEARISPPTQQCASAISTGIPSAPTEYQILPNPSPHAKRQTDAVSTGNVYG
ncbi:hypothetical protein TW65_06268 [Stemphylium lycopersici]|nr:hypothetical protein TW65_06268 [Stemphylium lycopersici]